MKKLHFKRVQMNFSTLTLSISLVLLELSSYSQSIYCGMKTSYHLCDNGSYVEAVGANYWGFLGIGTSGLNTNTNIPVEVNNIENVSSISANAHLLAVLSDGSIWAWGDNEYGQLGYSSDLFYSPDPSPIVELTDVIATAAGDFFSLALKNDGTVWSWGLNDSGQLGNGTFTNSTVPSEISLLSGIIAISVGGAHCLALKNDGTVWSWGYNASGQLGNGSNINSNLPAQIAGLSNVTKIKTTVTSSCVMKEDGSVWSFGHNGAYGMLGQGNFENSNVPLEIALLNNVVSISAGRNFYFAIKNDGTVWSWGENTYGQLGNGTNIHSNVPLEVSSLFGAVEIATGFDHAVAKTNDGSLLSWGRNFSGELGNGTNLDSNLPASMISCNDGNTTTISEFNVINRISNNSYFGDQIWAVNDEPIKICADGTSSTYFRIDISNNSNLDFRIVDELGIIQTDSSLFGHLGSQTSEENYVEVQFTHPTQMELAYPRVCYLEISQNGIPIPGATFEIRIFRTPVLFVHGLWGDNSAFVEMEDYFEEQLGNENIVTHRANYSSTNDLPFASNSTVVQTAINQTLFKARSEGFSCGAVDIVSHSMGGSLSRLYIQSSIFQARKDIRSLTTINTPHSGTQAANFLLSPYFVNSSFNLLMESLGRCVECGAVADLRINSEQTMSNLLGNDQTVPCLVYSSSSYISGTTEALAFDLIWALNSNYFISVGIFSPLLLAESLFSPDISDFIVPLESQTGGVATFTHYTNVIHTNAEKNPSLFVDLLQKLGHPTTSSYFNQNGFTLANLNMPYWFYLPELLPELISDLPESSTTLTIDSPVANVHFEVGQIVNFSVVRSDNLSTYLGCAILNSNNIIHYQSTFDSTLQFSIEISPNLFGTCKFIAFGLDNNNELISDSIVFFVGELSSIVAIEFEENEISLPVGLSQMMPLFGILNNGYNVILNGTQEVVYAVTNPEIVEFQTIQAFNVIGSGSCQLIAHLNDLTDTLLITTYVDPPSQVSNFSSSENILCGSDEVAFFSDSSPNSIGYLWNFEGGTPNASTDQHPMVSYNTPGTYDVTLITSWLENSDTLVVTDYIRVIAVTTPNISYQDALDICPGDQIMLVSESSNDPLYIWSDGTISDTLFVHFPGEFSVATLDEFGCTFSSASVVIGTSTSCYCIADINQDGFVDIQDLMVVIDEFSCLGYECFADINQDNIVSTLDIIMLIGQWGTLCND